MNETGRLCPFFLLVWSRLMLAKPEGKKEVGLGGILPRAAASAAWPWAIILPPVAGLRNPHGERTTQRSWSWLCEPSASSKAGFSVVFITSARSGLLEPNCSPGPRLSDCVDFTQDA